MKKLFCLSVFAALAGCQSAPMSDEQRALMGQYLMNQQRVNAQNYQTQMQMIQQNQPRSTTATCYRYGNQVTCNSN